MPYVAYLFFLDKYVSETLFAIVDALYAGGYRCEDFVWDGAESFGNVCYGEMRSENFDAVAYATLSVGNIDHHDVHADIANGGALLPSYKYVEFSTPEMAVDAISVANRNGGDTRGAVKQSASTITNGCASRPLFNRNDGSV